VVIIVISIIKLVLTLLVKDPKIVDSGRYRGSLISRLEKRVYNADLYALTFPFMKYLSKCLLNRLS
jgi:hypothetical protein